MLAQMIAGRTDRVVELFGGALGVSLSLMPRKAHINDNSPYLIGLYEAVKAGAFPAPVGVPNTEAKHRAAYANLKRLWKRGVRSGPQLGHAFYPVMIGAFNGIYRTNKDGMLGATGWNKRRAPRQVQNWKPYQQAFKWWSFSCADWAETPVKKGDLVIADPPYHDTWAGYSSSGFPFHEQTRLALAMLDHPGATILHNHSSMEKTYADLGFAVALIPHGYMSGTGAKKNSQEVIATKDVPLPSAKGITVVRAKQAKHLTSGATVRALSKRKKP